MLWTLLATTALAAEPAVGARDDVSVLIEQALAQDEAWEELAYLCDHIGARISGSPQLEKAVQYTAERMRDDGLQVSLESVQVPYWIRGEAELTELGPSPASRRLLALGGSAATPAEGIEGEVFVVSTFEELAENSDKARGKIVLFDAPFTTYGDTVKYRWAGADQAAKHGAVAALVRSVTPESLDTPHTGSMGYSDEVPHIPVAAITVEDAARYHRLQDDGVTPRVSLLLTPAWGEDRESHNVVGEVRGAAKANEIVVVGCHLDSWDVGQGAHDDGAGCTAVMEAVALIAARPTKPLRTVRAVLFTNEENGLRGGRAYAEAHAKESIVAAIEADTGAGAPLGFGVDVRNDAGEHDPAAIASALEHFAPYKGQLEPVGATDLSEGYSGADIGPLVKDGALGFGLRNDMAPYWRVHHTEADTLDKVDPALLQKNVAALATLTWLLANDPELPQREASP